MKNHPLQFTTTKFKCGLIKFARERARLTAKELAKRMHIHVQGVWDFESGKHKVSDKYLDRIIACLGMTPAQFWALVPDYLNHLKQQQQKKKRANSGNNSRKMKKSAFLHQKQVSASHATRIASRAMHMASGATRIASRAMHMASRATHMASGATRMASRATHIASGATCIASRAMHMASGAICPANSSYVYFLTLNQ